MSDPLSFRGKELLWKNCQEKYAEFFTRNSGIFFVAIILAIFGSVFQVWNSRPVFYSQAYSGKIGLFPQEEFLVLNNGEEAGRKNDESRQDPATIFGLKKDGGKTMAQELFAQKLYEMVGETPIREMVPYISKRDEKVAAFLVGIAKKESSWGEHVPLQNGNDCYNYWGYKGSASRGSAMGYACFANQEEAVKIVGDRIEVLINKNLNTASKMLVWKCGSSCAGHSPEGVKSWVATVAMYLEKIVG